MKDKILITGGTGRLGKDLVKLFPDCLHPTRKEMDITQSFNVEEYIEKNKPNIVIHLAALVDIRKCEENKEEAYRINVLGTSNIIRALEKHNKECYFIYISSPCVFRGDNGPYNELSFPYPKNFYGITKLQAETIVNFSRLGRKLIKRK